MVNQDTLILQVIENMRAKQIRVYASPRWGLSHHDAEDCFSETCIDVWFGHRNFTDRKHMENTIEMKMKWRVLDLLRNRRGRCRAETQRNLQQPLDEAYSKPSPSIPTHDLVEIRQTLQALRKVMRILTPLERKALAGRVEGHIVDRSRVKRARKKLREALA